MGKSIQGIYTRKHRDACSPGEIRIRSFFSDRGWRPFDFQRDTWRAYLRGGSGLVHAPTGVGKTLALWGGPLIEALDRGGGNRGEPSDPETLRVLWITPLRALAADTRDALEGPLRALSIPWTVGVRTGDTPEAERRRQRKKLPTALIITPESLSLLLSQSGNRDRFATLDAVFVDEWHELMGSKRGVMTELILARLKRRRPGVRIWGLSATLSNLDQAITTLLGPDHSGGLLIRGPENKKIRIDAVIPDTLERFPWAGHLGLRLLDGVLEAVERSRSTLIFTNTRSQAEQWYQAVLEARPDWASRIGLHHGSISSSARVEIESGLRQGRLKAVVCTSSLDLGVDFSPVDQVAQIGSPKGIARLIQRAGRSGHQPGQVSNIRFVPTHAFELLEIAAVRNAIEKERLESRPILTGTLDVLAQHMVTLALGGGFEADPLFDEVRKTAAFRRLSRDDFDWVVAFVTTGGNALSVYPEYRRVEQSGKRFQMTDRRLASRHRMNIGTITDDPAVWVKYLNGARLGSVEEAFAAKRKPGDHFVFAGKVLRAVRLEASTLYVRKARSAAGSVPRWMGGRMPLSTDLASEVRSVFELAASGKSDGPEMEALSRIFELQTRWSAIPSADELLIESVRSREGFHVFMFPFEGRGVHEGLASLFAYRISRIQPMTLSYTVNDYGMELLSKEKIPLARALEKGLFSESGLKADLLAAVNAAELAKRHFREISRIAGLVVNRLPGRRKSATQLQISAGLIFSVLNRYDPENRLLKQANQEVLERQLEWPRLNECLRRLGSAGLLQTQPPQITPLAFPIMADRLRASVSSEKLSDRLDRILKRLNRQADP